MTDLFFMFHDAFFLGKGSLKLGCSPPPSVFILYNKPEKYQNMDRDGGMSNTIATTRQFPSVISRSKLIKTRH